MDADFTCRNGTVVNVVCFQENVTNIFCNLKLLIQYYFAVRLPSKIIHVLTISVCFKVGPSMNDDLNRDAASLFFVWHTIMYLLITLIAILLCFPLVYCCCYRKYRQRKVRRRKETEVTMPRLIDTSSFHEQNEPGVKQLQLILSKG